MDKRQIESLFQRRYPGEVRVFRAPGRVNLIGEHTDYNDGYVFPMALDRYTYAAMAPRTDRQIRVFSANLEEELIFSLDNNRQRRGHWSDYVAGIAHMLEEAGFKLPGADMLIESNVPVGSGLSSSAALEVSTALAFLGSLGEEMNKVELARLCQKAENQFVGMNCGIMDQFISIHGQEGHALFLDCRSLDFRQVPISTETVRIVVCNTMVKHELGASQYNIRRSECEKGVEHLRSSYPDIKALRDVALVEFDRVASSLPQPERKRCRHVISENERVRASIAALESGDLAEFGRLMNASHNSLRDDYEVSCRELDLMTDIARRLPGCLGARMTGGGFGGCTVNLVEVSQVDAFCKNIAHQYEAETNLAPTIYITTPSQGAGEI